jgi:drug/metabolite transporter (DMT)-like permease
MPWYIFITISKLFDTTCIIFAKKVLNATRINPISFAISFQFVSGLIVGTFGIFTPEFRILPGKDFPWLNIILMVFLYSFSNVYYYKALEKVEASKSTIILTTSSIFAILTSYFFLGERLSIAQYIGGLIVFFGVIIATLEKMKIHIGQGELYLLFCAFCWGVELINDKFIMGSLGIYLFLFLGYTMPALLMMMLYNKETKLIPETVKILGKNKFIIYCLLQLSQSIFFYWGMNATESAGLVVILNLASKILTIFASIFILKETKNLWQKIFGIIIVIIGLYILN